MIENRLHNFVSIGRRSRLRDVALGIGLILGFILLLGWGEHQDSKANDSDNAYQLGIERGIEQGRAQMKATVMDAYKQGQHDALSASKGDANGLQIAQTCMAWWYDTPINKAALRKRVCGGRG